MTESSESPELELPSPHPLWATPPFFAALRELLGDDSVDTWTTAVVNHDPRVAEVWALAERLHTTPHER
jgi:hypothetical protein